MDINWLSIVVPAITAIIVAALMSVLPPWIAKLRSPEEEEMDRASAAGVISEASIKMVQHWQTRVEALETTVDKQEVKIKELEDKVEKQEQSIIELEKEAHSLLVENVSLGAQTEVYRKGAGRLHEQVSDLGHVPIWNP